MAWGFIADETALGTLITSLSDSVSDTLKNLGGEAADSWLLRQIGSKQRHELTIKACTYYAYAMILRNLYDTDQEDSAAIQWYEKEAQAFIDAYLALVPDGDDIKSPYSSRLTPSNRFVKRDKRTDYDYNDYDDVDRSKWDNE